MNQSAGRSGSTSWPAVELGPTPLAARHTGPSDKPHAQGCGPGYRADCARAAAVGTNSTSKQQQPSNPAWSASGPATRCPPPARRRRAQGTRSTRSSGHTATQPPRSTAAIGEAAGAGNRPTERPTRPWRAAMKSAPVEPHEEVQTGAAGSGLKGPPDWSLHATASRTRIRDDRHSRRPCPPPPTGRPPCLRRKSSSRQDS